MTEAERIRDCVAVVLAHMWSRIRGRGTAPKKQTLTCFRAGRRTTKGRHRPRSATWQHRRSKPGRYCRKDSRNDP